MGQAVTVGAVDLSAVTLSKNNRLAGAGNARYLAFSERYQTR